MKRLLWIGDAVVSSGFARCTHKILDVLKDNWDVHVLGLNYVGDPHEYPYPIYPCWPGGDAFGVKRTATLATEIKPDVIMIQNDPWNIPGYLMELAKLRKIPTVASMPVDGKNCRGAPLNGLTSAIFWTDFGLREARRGGFVKKAHVIPLGVDPLVYHVKDKSVVREHAKFTDDITDGFIVGNVNRNQPRKRLDLTVAYFAEWVKEYQVKNAYLYLHVAPTGDMGYDTLQLMRYYGLENRLILNVPELGYGIREDLLAITYNLFDVQVSTSQGEGWGLCTMEGMACGVPQIVPDWAALGEWTRNAAMKIPCDNVCVTPNNINVIGGVPNREEFIKGLDTMYRDEELRESYREAGLGLIAQYKFAWGTIGEQFGEALEEALSIQ